VKSILHSFQGFLTVAMAGALCCSLAGCGGGGSTTVTPPPITPPPVTPANPGVSFSGKALAGTQPIVGAAVQLYAAGTSGNGSASTALLTTALDTDATGSFTVPAGYACPAAASEIYIVVRGGQVGALPDNSAIALASALGACNQIATASKFVVNEVTTAATAWGLAQFLSAGGNVGATATNAQGLANAFATVANLVDPTAGTSPGAAFPKTGVSPAAKINTLANVLNNCTAAASACGQLFSATTLSGGSAPANTLDAVLNVVRNPGNSIAAIYAQQTTGAPFTPALTAAPSDWTLFINYSGGGIDVPSGLGIDSAGNIWVASYAGVASKFSNTGYPVFASGITGNGLMSLYSLAVDAQDNVWIPNQQSTSVNGGLGSVTVLNSSGQPLSGSDGYSSGGIYFPQAIAIDTNGTVWIVNNGNSSLTLLSSTGQPLSGAKGYTSTQFGFPIAVAIDGNHNGWVANQDEATVTKVSADGTQITSYACCDVPDGIAIDQRGDVWVANYAGDSISQLASDGTVISSGYSDMKASINHPQGMAIDGSGHVWVANYRGPSITELAGSAASSPGQILSPAAGYAGDAKLLEAYSIQIDSSGNVWITNQGSSVLTEVVGLGTPVKTPLIGPSQTP
jgi:sugar lactone lactonase YvrE